MRLLIAALFIYSGSQKLSVPLENFEEALRTYEIFPEFSIRVLSYFVPLAEVTMGALLTLGLLTRLALLGTLCFFGIFIAVISRALILKIPIENCGCFGEGLHLPPAVILGLDLGFFVLVLFLYLSKPSALRLESAFVRDQGKAVGGR